MTGQVVAVWGRQVVMYQPMREHFCQPEKTEAGACQKTRQVFVGGRLINKKTVTSMEHHYSLPLKRLVKHCESNGLIRKAGDGTRTRDSLLGRQGLAKPLLKSCQSACQANRLTLQKSLSGTDKRCYERFSTVMAKHVGVSSPVFCFLSLSRYNALIKEVQEPLSSFPSYA